MYILDYLFRPLLMDLLHFLSRLLSTSPIRAFYGHPIIGAVFLLGISLLLIYVNYRRAESKKPLRNFYLATGGIFLLLIILLALSDCSAEQCIGVFVGIIMLIILFVVIVILQLFFRLIVKLLGINSKKRMAITATVFICLFLLSLAVNFFYFKNIAPDDIQEWQKLAVKENNPSLCSRIFTDEDFRRDECLLHAAYETGNQNFCLALKKGFKSDCWNSIAISTGKSDICNNSDDPKECEAAAKAVTWLYGYICRGEKNINSCLEKRCPRSSLNSKSPTYLYSCFHDLGQMGKNIAFCNAIPSNPELLGNMSTYIQQIRQECLSYVQSEIQGTSSPIQAE